MAQNFEERNNRIGTNSLKWDEFAGRFPGLDATGAVPMWVADTDFKAPQQVIDLMVKKAGLGIYGYPGPKGETFDSAVKNWIQKRHQWELEKDWIVFIGGVVPMLAVGVQALTQEGEGVIIQPPVYYPFEKIIALNKRVTVHNALKYEGGTYEIDFADLEEKAKNPQNKMLVLCNPHNPVGRVWSKENLIKIAEICQHNGVIIFSDEIHSDLIYKGNQHIPIAALHDQYAQNSITAYSASKTFNLAGLQASCAVIPNTGLRRSFVNRMLANSMDGRNTFATEAMACAYDQGEEYLQGILAYVEANIDYAVAYFKENLPLIKVIKPQGTYLVWIDFTQTGWAPEEIDRFVIEEAKVAVDLGHWFGEEGKGFVRVNFACHRKTVEQALSQLKAAYARKIAK